MKTEFNEVVQALSKEREYQDKKWGDNSQSSVPEYLMYMEHYINKAKEALSTEDCVDVCDTVLSQVRKITALGIACGEQHGMPQRENQENKYIFKRGDLIIHEEDNKVYQCVCADDTEAVFGLVVISDTGEVFSTQYTNLFAVSNFKYNNDTGFRYKRIVKDDIIRSIPKTA